MIARRGSAYVVVLVGVSIVTSMGLAALSAVEASRSRQRLESDLADAQALAISGLELAASRLDDDHEWRVLAAEGSLVPTTELGDGKLRVQTFDDTDNDIGDSTEDPVVLVSVAQVGGARHAVECEFVPVPVPLEALRHAVVAGGDMTFDLLAKVHAIGSGATNGSATAVLAELRGDLHHAGALVTVAVSGRTVRLAEALDMPRNDAVSAWAARAVPIDPATIPWDGALAAHVIEGRALGPGVNPFGPTASPDGIYSIDAGGKRVVIRNSRILGTIILRNARHDSAVNRSVSWSTPGPHQPALIVEGNIDLSLNGETLREQTVGSNFNPPGMPFEGTTNTVVQGGDDYPCEIAGLVYATGSMQVRNMTEVNGCVLARGGIFFSGEPELSVDERLYDAMPTGFTAPARMVLMPGTVRQSLR